MALALAALGWELTCYLRSPRAAYPTFSSLLDSLTVHPAGKAVAFALWLALGWVLVGR